MWRECHPFKRPADGDMKPDCHSSSVNLWFLKGQKQLYKFMFKLVMVFLSNKAVCLFFEVRKFFWNVLSMYQRILPDLNGRPRNLIHILYIPASLFGHDDPMLLWYHLFNECSELKFSIWVPTLSKFYFVVKLNQNVFFFYFFVFQSSTLFTLLIFYWGFLWCNAITATLPSLQFVLLIYLLAINIIAACHLKINAYSMHLHKETRWANNINNNNGPIITWIDKVSHIHSMKSVLEFGLQVCLNVLFKGFFFFVFHI